MTCPYCKKIIDDDSDFCVHCGKSVVDEEANATRHRNKTKNGIIISAIIVALLVVGIIAIVQHNKAENNRIIKEAYLTIAQENPRGRNAFVTLLNEYFTEKDLKNYPDLVLADWEFDEANKSYTYSGNTPVKYSITYTTCQMDDETQDVNTVKAQVTIPDNGVPDDAVDFLAGVGYAFVMPVYKSSDVDRNNFAEFVYYSVTQPKAHDAGENFYYFGNVLARIDIYVTDGVAYLSALRYSTAQLKAQSIAQSSIASQPFSRISLIDHLLSLGYSSEDAELAVDCLNIDWKEQATLYAQQLLNSHKRNYTSEELAEALEEVGFTHEDALYASKNIAIPEPSKGISVTLKYADVYPNSRWGFAERFEAFLLGAAGDENSLPVITGEDFEQDKEGRWTATNKKPLIYSIMLTPEDPKDDGSDIILMQVDCIPMSGDQLPQACTVLSGTILSYTNPAPDEFDETTETIYSFILDSVTSGLPSEEGINLIEINDITFDLYQHAGIFIRLIAQADHD